MLGPGGSAPAPNFTLTDQHGRTVSLSQFRGKSVVLCPSPTTECTDICTLLAQDVAAADRDLGAAARDVVFLSVNANPYYPGVSARPVVDRPARVGPRRGNWVFVTGSPAALSRCVARLRGRGGARPGHPHRDALDRAVLHRADRPSAGRSARSGRRPPTPLIYAHALAQMADDDLPAVRPGERRRPERAGARPEHGGHRRPGARVLAARPRRRPPHAPAPASPAGPLHRAQLLVEHVHGVRPRDAGHRAGLPDLGAQVNFVGVDVSDNRRHGGRVRPPDRGHLPARLGHLGSRGRPPTRSRRCPSPRSCSPRGTLETLHPGAMFTTDQLEYVVENLDPALLKRP